MASRRDDPDAWVAGGHEKFETLIVEPGQPCPACARKVPHPKKPDSPKTKVWSVRVPVGDADAFQELVDAAAGYLGARGRPHSNYWVMHYAIVALLQAPDFEDALARVEQ